MLKRIVILLLLCIICLCFTGCVHDSDTIEILYKSTAVFDNFRINIKEGYFYERHELFTVDEDTVAVTIYFSKEDTQWD